MKKILTTKSNPKYDNMFRGAMKWLLIIALGLTALVTTVKAGNLFIDSVNYKYMIEDYNNRTHELEVLNFRDLQYIKQLRIDLEKAEKELPAKVAHRFNQIDFAKCMKINLVDNKDIDCNKEKKATIENGKDYLGL